jgi:hypothetical protein
MQWIKFENIEELPKDECMLVTNGYSIDYIIYCFGSWCFCHSEQKISENLLKTYNRYFIPTLV